MPDDRAMTRDASVGGEDVPPVVSIVENTVGVGDTVDGNELPVLSTVDILTFPLLESIAIKFL